MPGRRNARPVVWAIKRYKWPIGVRGTVIEVYPTEAAAQDKLQDIRTRNLQYIRRHIGHSAYWRECLVNRTFKLEEYRL